MSEPLLRAFREYYGDLNRVQVTQAPGRVNLMGDHTDYNDGFVLPMPVDRGVYVALRPREDRIVRLFAVNFGERLDYLLEERPQPPPSGWMQYVTGVVEELRLRDQIASGFEGVIYGDLPSGAGLSSSAALEVAIASGLQALFTGTLAPVEIATICRAVEHHYAGVQCGIMDQFTSRLGLKNHALFLDCRSLAFEQLPLPLETVSVVIVNSGVSRALSASKYNERREECNQAVTYFAAAHPGVQALRDVSSEQFTSDEGKLPERIRRRSEHVIRENERVLSARRFLKENELGAFGSLMYDSHASLRDLYEVSCSELDELVEMASRIDGVLGSRMTGAGFGGCTVSLVEKGAVQEFSSRISDGYRARFARTPAILVVDKSLEVTTFSGRAFD